LSPLGTASFEVPTDSDGRFRIDMMPVGEYDVATSDEYKGDLRSIKFPAVKPSSAVRATALAGNQCSSVTLRQPPRARLHLNVSNLLTGEPIKSPVGSFRFGALSLWDGGTNKQGDLFVPPNADLEVHVGAHGYENSEIIKISSLQPGEVHEVSAALRPVQTGCLVGSAVDQQSLPVIGVKIQPSISAEHLETRVPSKLTDKNGRFRFDGVQPGDYTVFTDAAGYPPTLNQEGLEYARVSVQPISACADIAIRLGPKAAKLRVRVVDAVTRKPLQGSTVWLDGEHGGHGLWSLRVIGDPMLIPALRQFHVSARAQGYLRSQTLTISPLQPEETQQLTIELQPDRTAH
jgi:hypothetical protein